MRIDPSTQRWLDVTHKAVADGSVQERIRRQPAPQALADELKQAQHVRLNWSVDFEGPFRAWVAGDRPSDALIDAVSFWLTVAEGVWTAVEQPPSM